MRYACMGYVLCISYGGSPMNYAGVTKTVRTSPLIPKARKGTVGPLSIMGPLSYMGPLFYVGPL